MERVRLLLICPVWPAFSTCCCAGGEPSLGRPDIGWDDLASSLPYRRRKQQRAHSKRTIFWHASRCRTDSAARALPLFSSVRCMAVRFINMWCDNRSKKVFKPPCQKINSILNTRCRKTIHTEDGNNLCRYHTVTRLDSLRATRGKETCRETHASCLRNIRGNLQLDGEFHFDKGKRSTREMCH